MRGEVTKIVGNNASVALIGHEKDSSSYYLKVFPQWDLIETGNYKGINATDFRNVFFSEKKTTTVYENVPDPIVTWLKKYRRTKAFKEMQDKFLLISRKNEKNVKKDICNAFVMCGGYILFVKREEPLSRGLLALPESYPNQGEEYLDCAINALMKETNINLPKETIRSSYYSEGIFGYPERYPICRLISYTFFYNLTEQTLPKVYPGKGIKEVEWVLLEDYYLRENEVYSDNFQIIQWFLNNKNPFHK